ncbi:MAG: Bug family tripartite tricarboxylate transporter substrate binding protein [Qingshengfaniella sp.]
MNTFKSLLLGGATATTLAFGALPALAQDYPSEPIHIVVVWPAGGGHDIAARLLGEGLSTILDTPVVIDNITGAGGATGMRHLENAKPDGYTIGVMGMHAVSQSFMNTNATPLANIEPLAYVSDEPGALQVTASTGIETLDDYVAAMKADPSAIINGNDPQGGNSFVFANVMEDALDIEVIQIPYAGHAPNVTALITDEVGSATLPVPPVLEHHRNGTVKILGVMSNERHHLLPDVPTFKEQGYDVVANDFLMVVGPVGIPEDVKATLGAGLLEAVNSDGFREKASANGMVLRPGNAAMAAEELARQVDTIYPLLNAAGLVKPELTRK